MEQIAVMQNIFFGRKVTKIFDLKGSTRGRYINGDHQTHEDEESNNTNKNVDDNSSSNNNNNNNNDQTGDNSATSAGDVLLDENFLEYTKGRPLPLTDRSKAIFHMSILNDTLFLSIINIIDYSILVGIDEERHELVVGIIDYMRQYDILKQMERVGKSVGMMAGQEAPTIIQPNNYKARFQAAMDKYFATVPSKWTSTV